MIDGDYIDVRRLFCRSLCFLLLYVGKSSCIKSGAGVVAGRVKIIFIALLYFRPRRGVDTNIVMPRRFKVPSISQKSIRETGSTPVVGSSNNNTLGR